MPDILTLDHEDDHFGHVGGVVGDPLQMPGNGVDLDGPGNGAGVLEHVGQQYPLDLLVEEVHLIVAVTDRVS